jgi:ribosomal protein S18 acetylase RimI-like enzyme
MVEDRGLPIGCLACPPDPPGISWVQIFAAVAEYDRDQIWFHLWDEALQEVSKLSVGVIQAISNHDWLTELMQESNFQVTNRVIFMEWNDRSIADTQHAPGSIRPFVESDIPAVLSIDSRAFKPTWRHSEDAFHAALMRTALARVCTIDGEIRGYQLSTANAFAVHLARLAVDPDWQGMGIASSLTLEVIEYSRRYGQSRVTVNTQADNLRSQDLYRRLGFRSSGQEFPLLEFQL